MKRFFLAALMTALFAWHGVVLADDDGRRRDDRRWGEEEWEEIFRDGPCEVKIESKRGEYKREVKCRDGVGAWWDGEWKRSFRDGPCRVEQEAKQDEFKEEVKCDERD